MPWIVLVVLLASLGCASGSGTPTEGDGGNAEAGTGPDMEAEVDQGMPMADMGVDMGPPTVKRTCEACETHDECAAGSFCVNLTEGGKACVPGCVPDLPTCPRAFSCVLDIGSGVDETVCLPVGGLCCVDEDADDHGLGVGCLGPDCNDLDPDINPDVEEVCDGIDQNCNMMVDDPPTDCVSGRCRGDGDGTYTAVVGADCSDAMCAEGTVSDCMLFTCELGGAGGNECAPTCMPDGTEDDSFCIESAHCIADGTCEEDIPNGQACVQDTDCVSSHCENGFCCDGGTCCGVDTDCPGGGSVTNLCDTASTCQGTRGETQCNDSFVCETISGIDDDSACESDTLAKNCGLYDPVYCDGTTNQSEPTCASSCTTDADCVDIAHCDTNFCVPDRDPGASCMRNQDCKEGLTCTDGVCCTSACTGTCQACNVTGSLGSCVNVPANTDPAGECPGFSCMNYYDGFGASENSCYFRQNVSDSAATCNGGGACVSQATACSTSPRGTTQITCDATCQDPTGGTCSGMTPGACTDLDDPSDTTTCGTGACEVTVQRCTGGSPTACNPGTPVAETCNGIDDDCNGTVDNGTDAALCPPPMVGVNTTCDSGACRLEGCASGTHDVNGDYMDGCECTDDGAGNSCGAALTIGTLSSTGSSTTHMGKLIPGQEDWLTVSFPQSTSRGPGLGAPSLEVTHSGGGSNPFRMRVVRTCTGSPIACNGSGDPPAADSVTEWSFRDDQSTPGARQWSGPHTVAWPSTVLVRVTRTTGATTCSEASYTLTASR